jgi:hypothetical protein
MLLAFICSQWRLLQGKHVWDSTHFVLTLAPRSQRRASISPGLPKFYVATKELYNKHLLTAIAVAVVGGQDKALLMWVRRKNLARHTNQQGRGN